MRSSKPLSRRHFLNGMKNAGLAGLTTSTLGVALSGFQQAAAAEVAGYKAIVCLFFIGGMDSHDTILPYDQPSYDRFADIRASLFSSHNGARNRNNLLELTPSNGGDFEGRRFALTPDFRSIHDIIQSGNGAIIGNVGPLLQPTTLTEFNNSQNIRPRQLFSHIDQQAAWLTNGTNNTQSGWGGRFIDPILKANQNNVGVLSSIALSGGHEFFLSGELSNAFRLNASGATELDIIEHLQNNRSDAQGERVYQLMRKMLSSQSDENTHLLKSDVGDALNHSLETNELYNNAVNSTSAPPIAMPIDNLGNQLSTALQTIRSAPNTGMRRQIFYVGVGGFDTHSDQANKLTSLHQSIDSAVSSFYQNLVSLNLADKVTLFTASDFGRSLSDNGGGTDHGWGGHHFVIGDAVRGNHIYGDIPPHAYGHDWDIGRGRLLPTTSIEEYAAPLGRWFGLTDAEVNFSLPNLNKFQLKPDLNYLI